MVERAKSDNVAVAMGVLVLLLAGLLVLLFKDWPLLVGVVLCLSMWGVAGVLIRRYELRLSAVGIALLVLVLQTLFVLVAGETLARFSGLAAPQRFQMFQPVAGAYYELRSNYTAEVPIQLTADETRNVPVRISQQGLRDEWVGEKGPDERRILCLGDSFTFGWGVSEANGIPARLEGILNDQSAGQHWRVINAGVSGYSPWQALTWLRTHGLAFKPDIVLLQTFVANDLADTLTQLGQTTRWLRNQRPFRVRILNRFRNDAQAVMGFDNWLYGASHLYYLACTRTDWDPVVYRLATRFRLAPEVWVAEAPHESDAPVEYEPDRRERYPALDQAWELFASDLAAMRDLCAQNEIEFVAYNIPFHFSAAEQEAFFAGFPGVYVPDQGDRQVEALFKQLGIPFVPVLAWMRTRPEIEAEYFPANLHLNEAGNQALASHLAERLDANRRLAGASN